jgi:hypothetical protein
MQSVAEKQQSGLARPLGERIDEAVTNAVIAGEGVPALELATSVVHENEELFREQIIYQTSRLILAKRRKMAHVPVTPLFPEFEKQFAHIPKRIVMPDGKKLRKGKMTWRQYARFSRTLEARFQKDPLRAEVKSILKLMQPYAHKIPGITYDEVKRLESEKHGWAE